jgi:hypothetical protein
MKLSATVKEAVADVQIESWQEKTPKRVLALSDLEHAKTAVLNSLTSASGQRTYDHAIREFVTWCCSDLRLAFNRTRCFGTGFTSNSTDTRRPRSIFGSPRYDALRTKQPTPAR